MPRGQSLSAYGVCRLMTFVDYKGMSFMLFVAYEVCRPMTFVSYKGLPPHDVCRLQGLSPFDVCRFLGFFSGMSLKRVAAVPVKS